MPKNPVTDPITDQEMAFAHLVLSGTMNDRRAAEAVGLNPASAAYIKSKPLVRAYMIEHRAAVEAKLVNQEAEGMRARNAGRDQILSRLWELANLNPEVTRGSMAGQIKALAMIIAIEGLVPDRRISPAATPSAHAPFTQTSNAAPEWSHQQQPPTGNTATLEPDDPEEAAASPAAHRRDAADAKHQNKQPKHQDQQKDALAAVPQQTHTTLNPFIDPEKQNPVPAIAGAHDAVLDRGRFRNLSYDPTNSHAGNRR